MLIVFFCAFLKLVEHTLVKQKHIHSKDHGRLNDYKFACNVAFDLTILSYVQCSSKSIV